MNFTRGLSVILVLMNGASAWGAPAESLDAVRQSAIGLYQNGRLDAALPLYQQLARSQPKSSVALKDLLWVLWKSKRFEEVVPVARQLTELQPRDIESWNFLAQSAEAAGQTQTALEAYRRLYRLEPGRLDVRRAMARLLYDLKQYDEAASLLMSIRNAQPDSSDIYPELARVQCVRREYSACSEAWSYAVAADPANFEYRLAHADALYLSGKRDMALSRLRKLSQERPDDHRAIEYLVNDVLARGDDKSAAPLMEERLVKMVPQDEPWVIKLAACYGRLGRTPEATRILERLREVNPESMAATLLLGNELLRQGKAAEAAAAYEQVLARNPNSLSALSGLADARLLLRDTPGALASIQRATALDPADAELALREAQILYAAGQVKESSKRLNHIIKSHKEVQPVMDPRRDAATRALRQLLRQSVWQADLGEARRAYTELTHRSIPDADLLSDQARLRMASGDTAGALRLARQSLEMKDDADTRELIAALEKGDRQGWWAEMAYGDDSDDRELLALHQGLGAWALGPTQISLLHHAAKYFEPGVGTLWNNGGGIEVAAPLNLSHKVSVKTEGHFMDSGAPDAISAIGSVHSAWRGSWESDLSGGQNAFDTASGLQAGILDRFGKLQVSACSQEDWRFLAEARLSKPSDGNSRVMGGLEAAHTVFAPWLRGVLRSRFENTQDISRHYYSPQELQTHQAGLELGIGKMSSWRMNLRYLPGAGHELGTDWQVIHDLEASLPMAIGRLSVQPVISWRDTPTYRSNYYGLFLSTPL